MKLEISLFRFDKNSDYLPYYTKHFIKIEKEKNLLDILNTINKISNFSYEKNPDFDLVLNGIYVKASIALEEIVKNFTSELIIEPISTKRVYKDLLIDTKDFEKRVKIFEDLIDEKDINYYRSLKQYYYASNTLNYEPDYIGDSTLLLCDFMINKNPKLKDIILNRLKEHKIDASFHTSLSKRIYNFDENIEKKILELQKDLAYIQSLDFKHKIDFGVFEDTYEIKHNFDGFNIAYKDDGDLQTKNLLESLGAKILNLKSLKLDLAKNTFKKNPKITFYVAATILNEAFDNNADFVLVDNDDTFFILDNYRKELKKICGRDITIPILHKNELQKLAIGKHDEVKMSLLKHKINPEII